MVAVVELIRDDRALPPDKSTTETEHISVLCREGRIKMAILLGYSLLPAAHLALGHRPRAVALAHLQNLAEVIVGRTVGEEREADRQRVCPLARPAHVPPRVLAEVLEEFLVTLRERKYLTCSFGKTDHQERPARRAPDPHRPNCVGLAVVRQGELGHIERLDIVQGRAGAAQLRREILLLSQENDAAQVLRLEQAPGPRIVREPERIVAAAFVDERYLHAVQRGAQGQLEHFRALVAVSRLLERLVVERRRAHAANGRAWLRLSQRRARGEDRILRRCFHVALARHGTSDLMSRGRTHA